MRKATLDRPPIFRLAESNGPHLRLDSDTAAIAHIFVLEEDIIRLLVLPEGRLRHPRSWTIAPGQDDTDLEGRDRFDLSGFAGPDFTLAQDEDRLVVETARLRLAIRWQDLKCRWHVRRGDEWLAAARDRPTQAYDFGWWGGAVRHYLARDGAEQYFGLGECSGAMDRSGRRLRLSNVDAMGYDARISNPLYKHIPFYLTRRRDNGLAFGLFYDTLADCIFDFGLEHSNYHGLYRYFAAEHGDLDLYFIAGPEIPEIVRRFTWLTGRPAATPDWALSYSGSTMSYTDAPDAQARLAQFLSDLERHDIPCGSFHLSSGYTSIGGKRYVFNWNRDKFPDPKGFVDTFARAGVKLIANIKPALLSDHPEFDGAPVLKDASGRAALEQFWDGFAAYLDFTDPKATEWWTTRVKERLLDLGIAATWNDNNEFEITSPQTRADGFGHPFPAHEMKPLQTMLMLRASRAAQLEHAPEEIPYLISRAGAAGLQRYAQTWSGDNYTSWETLKWNIRMGLGLALSGVSNIGHDVGGFAGPRPDAELFVRWIGFGVFMPRFSIHSWNDDGTVNEPWMHPEILDDVRRLMTLRTALVPELKALLARYRAHFEPVLRPIFYDFPDDPFAYDDRDDFMLGDRILVAPVVEPGATSLTVRLPKGPRWKDAWRDQVHSGGTSITVPAPFHQPPFFRRADD